MFSLPFFDMSRTRIIFWLIGCIGLLLFSAHPTVALSQTQTKNTDKKIALTLPLPYRIIVPVDPNKNATGTAVFIGKEKTEEVCSSQWWGWFKTCKKIHVYNFLTNEHVVIQRSRYRTNQQFSLYDFNNKEIKTTEATVYQLPCVSEYARYAASTIEKIQERHIHTNFRCSMDIAWLRIHTTTELSSRTVVFPKTDQNGKIVHEKIQHKNTFVVGYPGLGDILPLMTGRSIIPIASTNPSYTHIFKKREGAILLSFFEIQQGMSGSGIFNDKGEIMGIANSFLEDQNITFSIPIGEICTLWPTLCSRTRRK